MKARLLLIDDDIDYLHSLRRSLRAQTEWALYYATSALEAREFLETEAIDAIVLDFHMPVMNGLELLENLRDDEKLRSIPVIIVTGKDDGKLKRKALELGAADLLNKPVQLEDLIARIKNALDLKAAQDQLRDMSLHLQELVNERTRELELSRLDVLWCLAKAGEYRDQGTSNHVIRVGWYSKILAEAMGMTEDFCSLILLTSPLHDIGKIGIPDTILFKESYYSPEDYWIMQRHCFIGAEILLHNPVGIENYAFALPNVAACRIEPSEDNLLWVASRIALSHHEWWNGCGYPQGLKGEEIPLEARIVALADVYDALSSPRPYKAAFSLAQVVPTILEAAGKQFDPSVISAFERSLDSFQDVQARLKDTIKKAA